MPILETLAKDHRALEQTISELGATPGSSKDTRLELFARLQALLQSHSRAEEEVVYRRLHKQAPEEAKVLEAYEEHHIADILLQELASDCPGGAGWAAKVRVLEELLRHHIKQEEQILFPLLDQLFVQPAQAQMDREFKSAKHEKLEAFLGPIRMATPAFAGRAVVSAQAAAGRYVRRGELYVRDRWQRMRNGARDELRRN